MKNTITIHGMTKSPEHKAWSEMKQRCHNPNSDKYKHYGARGIKVFDGWINDFEAFFAHVGKKPGKEYSLDRIDNDGNYEPGNVRWATQLTQVRNRRSTHKITINGQEMTIKELADEHGIQYATLWARLFVLNIDPETAIKPGDRRRSRFSAEKRATQ